MKGILLFSVLSIFAAGMLAADDFGSPESVPAGLSEDDFDALRKTSPFTRVLSLPETYALRGVAVVDGVSVATLYNRETEKTLIVTPEGDNEAGLSLVDVIPALELEGVTAKVSFAGEEAELKYELSQLTPQPRSASSASGSSGSSREGEGEGERRGPSPQDIERYRSLPEDKQAKFREYITHVTRAYPDMSREERGNLIRGAMVRLLDGRELEVPSAPPQSGGSSSGSSSGDRSSSERGSSGSRSSDRGGDRR